MSWFRRKDRERDLDRELLSDVELEAEELRESGLSAEDAEYAARRSFGNTTLIKEDVRRTWAGMWLEDLFKDIRQSMQYLRRSPGFAAMVVLSLAIGIGSTTVIFTIINSVLLKSLPVRDPGGLLVLGPSRGSGNGVGIPRDGSFSLYSYDLYKHLQSTNVFSELCAVESSSQTTVSVRRTGWSQAQPAQARLVSGNYFDVLGIKAAVGRLLRPSDDSASARHVAAISSRHWNDKLGGDPTVIGSVVYVGGTPFTIVGVTPAEFFGETLEPDPPGLWLPISADRQLNRERALLDRPEVHWLYLIGRLQPNLRVPAAQARLNASLRNWLLALEGSDPDPEDRRRIARSHIELTPGASGIVHMQRNYSLTLGLLLGISCAVLLITCANIANLLLARGVARKTETSICLALGASRQRLIRQSLTESLILAVAGGVLGLVAASALSRLLIALFFRGSDYVPIQTSPDFRILAFTMAVSCGAAIIFGLLPALRMSGQDMAVIKGASPGIKHSRLSRGAFGLGAALVIGEVALSLVVLAGAGTFARSLANLKGQELGFNRDRTLIINIDAGHAGYDYHRLQPLYDRIYARLNSLPGVKSASLSYYSPFNDCCWAFSVSVQGYTPKAQEEVHARLNRVSRGYFQTIGTPVLLGRTFDEHDTSDSRGVAVVNQEFVRRFIPDGHPVGKTFGIGGEAHVGDLEIVGVVKNAKYDSPWEEVTPMAFLPLLNGKAGSAAPSSDETRFADAIEVRSNARPDSVAAAVRRALAEIDPNLPVLRVRTLSENIDTMLNRENVTAVLATLFGLIGLLLSCLGLYGLMAYAVQRRTSEIGVRVALGARRTSIIGMVLREALMQGVIGILIGVPAALAAMRLIASQLYGVSPNDPEYSIAAALILLACIAVAGYNPALRASRVDPIVALRYE